MNLIFTYLMVLFFLQIFFNINEKKKLIILKIRQQCIDVPRVIVWQNLSGDRSVRLRFDKIN